MPADSSSSLRAIVLALLAAGVLIAVLWSVGSGAATPQAISTPQPLASNSTAYRAGNGVTVIGSGSHAADVASPAQASVPAGASATSGTPTAAAASNASGKSELVARVTAGCAAKDEAIVAVDHDLAVRSEPTQQSEIIGKVPAVSPYLKMPVSAWVRRRSCDGRWGLVTAPWTLHPRSGWIRLDGLVTSGVNVHLDADLSTRTLKVLRDGQVLYSAPIAVGAAGSPSPVGDFWVNDPVSVAPDQPEFGSFAFGLSALQPHPPQGWTGGNQMAIHGTNDPGSIGTRASAGCLRVSEHTLTELRTLVTPGTPVSIHP